MAVFTNAGLVLLATAIQTPGAQAGVSYVGLGTGAGTLSSALTSGLPYSSLPLALPLTVAIASGQSLTLMDGVGDAQILTALGDAIGDTAILVATFTANANYGIGSGIVNTPSAADTALQNEVYRLSAIGGFAGTNPGESLSPSYFDPTTPTNIFLEVGFFGSAGATSSVGTGILMIRDAQYWNHTLSVDSAAFYADTTL